MPLKAITMTNKYSCVFGTIGPVKEEWGPDVLTWVNAFWAQRAVYASDYPARLKFETSNEGYPHFHIGVMLQERTKFNMFVTRLQKFLVQYKKDKPNGYDKNKEFSVRLFAVPTVETHNRRVLRGKALIDHYLDEPTKEKSVDGGNWQIEVEGFNAARHIEQEEDTVVQNKKRRWLAKYHKLVANGHDLPPLELLQNVPHGCQDFDQFVSRWVNGPLNPKNAHVYAQVQEADCQPVPPEVSVF